MTEFYEQGPIPPHAEVEVGTGEWRQASGEQTIGAYALGPCMGVAVLDPTVHSGYVAHTAGTGPGIGLDTIREMLQAATAETATLSTLRAWAGGNSPTPGARESEEDIAERREAAIACLVEAGIPAENIVEDWEDNPDLTMDMVLDCASGTCYTAHNDVSY